MEAVNERTPEKISRKNESHESLSLKELQNKNIGSVSDEESGKDNANILLDPNDQPSFTIDFWLICVLVVCLLILSFSLLFFLKAAQMPNEVESVLIPQPFTENNDLMFFHLPNKLRVMIVKPNTQQNNTCICELISFDFGRRI